MAGRSSLFRRIYVTLIASAIIAAAVAALAGWFLARTLSSEWVAGALEHLTERSDAIAQALDDPHELEDIAAEMAEELGTEVGIYDGRRRRVAGSGPGRLRGRPQLQRLRRGQPAVTGRNRDEPTLLFPIVSTEGEPRPAGYVRVVARSRSRWLVVIPSVALVLGILGAGAWQLSNALGSRLHRLERGTRKIADGDLAHRIDLSDRSVRDELDDLSVAFNDMAARLQQLVGAQQTLLANVSHELRTPLARMRVVLEIVEERLEGISTTPSEAHERLRTAVADMAEDLGETEVLIRDLLTSGRLALREGNKQDSETLDLAAIGHKLAARFEARSEIEGDLKVAGEPLLLERLLSNLLANARRASPRGDVLVRMYRRASRVAIEVQDDGPGISPEQREAVFEAFVRLDAARSRDTGGTGLGLFLARQICRSHGGSIRVEGREDGRSGARFIVELPASSAGDESRQPAPDVAP